MSETTDPHWTERVNAAKFRHTARRQVRHEHRTRPRWGAALAAMFDKPHPSRDRTLPGKKRIKARKAANRKDRP